MTAATATPRMESLADYLEARNAVIAAREGFFFAIKAYLRPEQRPDAPALGDPTAAASLRSLQEDDFIINPARGYFVVLERKDVGRDWRLSVLQQGNALRIGVLIPEVSRDLLEQNSRQLSVAFSGQVGLGAHNWRSTGKTLLDWSFDASDLYGSAQSFEDGVYKVGSLFETAIHTFQ